MKNPKLLWSGSFTAGSITVSGADKYAVFVMILDNIVAAIGTRGYGVAGFMSYGSYNIELGGYRLLSVTSGNDIIWTIDAYAKGGGFGGHGAAITAIYGIC